MADGRTHESYVRAVWKPVIVISGLSFLLTLDIYYPLFILINFGLTEVISADLDHSVITKDQTDAKSMSRKVSLALLLSKRVKKNSKLRMFLSKINLGLLGALFSGWAEVYEYLAWTFGGHRSWVSHGVLGINKKINRILLRIPGINVVYFCTFHTFSVLTLMIWFNLPLVWIMYSLVNYAITVWGHPTWAEIGWRYFYMDKWLLIYLGTQFIVWCFTGGIHIILDTEWSKGRLYGFKKYGDKRNRLLRKISNLILII